MIPTTLNYLRAIEHELLVIHERFEAASTPRRSRFSLFEQQRAEKRREEAARAFKHQQEYFQLMGIDWMEAA
jgi:hypothetical protein